MKNLLNLVIILSIFLFSCSGNDYKNYTLKINDNNSWRLNISYLDSAISSTYDSEIIDSLKTIKGDIYYKAHTFILNDSNFYNQSKKFTAYSEKINYKTKTVEYKKDFVTTELYVYKESIRKSIKYFSSFEDLENINLILYSSENNNKYYMKMKKTDLNCLNINWGLLRKGTPTPGDYGYNLPKYIFEYGFIKKKLRNKTYKLTLDTNRIKKCIILDKAYDNMSKTFDNNLSAIIRVNMSNIVKVPSSLEFYSGDFGWNSSLFLDKVKYISYSDGYIFYKVKFRSKNSFGDLVVDNIDVIVDVEDENTFSLRK